MNIAANYVVGLLIALLVIAAWSDLKARRIPNWLVLSGILAGLIANGLLPAGLGLNNTFVPGGIGWVAALQGIGLGLAALLPLYLLKAMGAGDDGFGGGFLRACSCTRCHIVHFVGRRTDSADAGTAVWNTETFITEH